MNISNGINNVCASCQCQKSQIFDGISVQNSIDPVYCEIWNSTM